VGNRAELAIDGPTAVLTMCRGEKRNALDAEMTTAIRAALRETEAADVRAVVLAAEGPAFCAGGDLKYLLKTLDKDPNAGTRIVYEHYQGLIKAMIESPCVLIAALDGVAIGAGLDLALACDLRIGTERASLAESWAQRGLIPGTGGAWLLACQVGLSHASRLVLDPEPISAAEALELGLLHELASSDELLGVAVAKAQKVAELPGPVAREAKALLWRAPTQTLDEALLDARTRQGPLIASEEFRRASRRALA
jgi:2-(1,2-epoxy-1,2-dihydrophenyl)acetyl-CoA isomerase